MCQRNAPFSRTITRKQLATIVSLSIFIHLVTACALIPSNPQPAVTRLPRTLTLPPPEPTQTSQSAQTKTPVLRCTPPPCQAHEVYHCPDECPGGCGTICATNTPLSAAQQPTPTVQPRSNVEIFPNPAHYAWKMMASNLSSPIGLTHAGDGSNRLFILEQEGVIRILQNGELRQTPFIDLRTKVDSGGNERGLLGLAFHPNYRENGQFFINYTTQNKNSIVSRLEVSTDTHIADPNSENTVISIKQPYQNHNGGHLLFGPDGYLYIGLGDGGSAGDPEGHGQNLTTLLGSMLRLDIDQNTTYAIPADNPYVNDGGRPEIWASGLRNPWRYSFDRLTGDLYIGDVGQNQWEEIHFWAFDRDHSPNFGWNYWEGLHPYQGNPPEGLDFEFPIWEYGHDQGCSVTGGFVYRGTMPEWQGIYIYGDFCSGRIWGLLRDGDNNWQNTLLFETGFNIASFGEDEAGEVYLVDRTGSIYQLTQR